eukprot:12807108-Alexandrium_andersonii.AAC.1
MTPLGRPRPWGLRTSPPPRWRPPPASGAFRGRPGAARGGPRAWRCLGPCCLARRAPRRLPRGGPAGPRHAREHEGGGGPRAPA